MGFNPIQEPVQPQASAPTFTTPAKKSSADAKTEIIAEKHLPIPVQGEEGKQKIQSHQLHTISTEIESLKAPDATLEQQTKTLSSVLQQIHSELNHDSRKRILGLLTETYPFLKPEAKEILKQIFVRRMNSESSIETLSTIHNPELQENILFLMLEEVDNENNPQYKEALFRDLLPTYPLLRDVHAKTAFVLQFVEYLKNKNANPSLKQEIVITLCLEATKLPTRTLTNYLLENFKYLLLSASLPLKDATAVLYAILPLLHSEERSTQELVATIFIEYLESSDGSLPLKTDLRAALSSQIYDIRNPEIRQQLQSVSTMDQEAEPLKKTKPSASRRHSL